MQIRAVLAIIALAFSACTFPVWKNPSGKGSDAGDAGSSGAQSCVDSRGLCFGAPELTTASWGLTSISLGSRSGTPTVILAAYGSAEIVEFQDSGSQIVQLGSLSVTPSPWQALGSDFNLDGNEDYVVASPGSTSRSGAVGIWLSTQADNWSDALTQTVGSGTYAVASRQKAISGEVVAVGASYNSQSLLPITAHRDKEPTAGKTITLDFSPTAAEFSNLADSAQLFVVGTASGHGKLMVFDVAGESLNEFAGCDALGSWPNDVKLADLNGDALVDAVVIDDSEQSGLYTVLGNSSNTLKKTKQLDLPAHSHAATVSDFDHDGYWDVATISGCTSTIQVCFGDGTGAFGSCVQVPHGLVEPTDLVTFDSTADGRIDILAIGYEGQLSRVRLNPCRDN